MQEGDANRDVPLDPGLGTMLDTHPDGRSHDGYGAEWCHLLPLF
jgi:hypothetical protein